MSARVLPFRTSQQRMPSPEDIEAREVASMFATLRRRCDDSADALKVILAKTLDRLSGGDNASVGAALESYRQRLQLENPDRRIKVWHHADGTLDAEID